MRRYAIIVAAGSGSRMGSPVPKQFLILDGLPILMHTINKFEAPNTTIIVALAANMRDSWSSLCNEHNFKTGVTIANGGETRFQSVKNALALITEPGTVAVHDGARPLVSPSLIASAYQVAEKKGNAVPSLPVSESLREIKGDSSFSIARNNYRIIQTPQCFYSETLQRAYKQAYSPLFTDDASVVEQLGERINLISGEAENIKITTPIDLALAQTLMAR
jgi:2-C-methyl-D-erythritol 4-phosphate cytidylyltransferase